MFPYIAVYIYIILCVFLEDKIESKLLSVFFSDYSILFVLIVFSGLRANGNGDYFNYYNAVPLINSFSKIINPVNYPFEIGFRIISYINNIFKFDPQFTIFTLSFITLVNTFYVFKSVSKNFKLSLLLYYPFLLIFVMHHSRSGVAMSFALLSYLFYIKKEHFKSLLMVLIGYLFHRTILVFVIFLLIKGVLQHYNFKEITKKHKHLELILMVCLYVVIFFVNPAKLLVNILSITPFKELSYKLLANINNPRWSYPFSLLDPRLLIIVLTYIYAICTKEKNSLKHNEKPKISLRLFSLATYISIILFSESTLLVVRVSNYFNQFIALALPNNNEKLILRFKNNSRENILVNFAYLAIIIGNIVYSFALIYRQVPYKFFIKL